MEVVAKMDKSCKHCGITLEEGDGHVHVEIEDVYYCKDCISGKSFEPHTNEELKDFIFGSKDE